MFHFHTIFKVNTCYYNISLEQIIQPVVFYVVYINIQYHSIVALVRHVDSNSRENIGSALNVIHGVIHISAVLSYFETDVKMVYPYKNCQT